MKLRMLGLLFALPLVFFACEDGDATGEEETVAAGGAGAAEAAAGGGAGAAVEAAGPDAACAALIEAIKAKNVEGVVGASGDGAAEVVTAESIEGLAGQLGEGACGEAMVEGDAATVTVTVGDEAKELAFAKVGDAWKFDAKAFLGGGEAAPAEEAVAEEPKGKKKKKKKKGKKKKK